MSFNFYIIGKALGAALSSSRGPRWVTSTSQDNMMLQEHMGCVQLVSMPIYTVQSKKNNVNQRAGFTKRRNLQLPHHRRFGQKSRCSSAVLQLSLLDGAGWFTLFNAHFLLCISY